MMWYNKKSLDFFFLILLVVVCGFTWRHLPETILRSDGYIHMLSHEQNWFWGQKYAITGLETGAEIFGALFVKLFGPHVGYYLWAELVTILIIDILFYLLVRFLTRNSFIAFFASLIFGVSYFGSWDMYSSVCYCFFLARVINMVVVIPSFIFLHLALEKGKNSFFIYSVLLYFLGVGTAHFLILFTPPFFLYPIFWSIFSQRKNKKIFNGVLQGFVFLAMSAFFVWIQQINEGGLGPSWKFSEFLLHPIKYQYVEKTILQFLYWMQYPSLIHLLRTTDIRQYSPSFDLIQKYQSFILLFFVFSFFLLYKKFIRYRAIIFTCVFSFIAIFFLNAYINQYPILYSYGSSRYLYFPTYLLAIFWSFLIWFFVSHRQIVLKLFGLFLLAGYVFINFLLIDGAFYNNFHDNKPTTKIVQYVLDSRYRLPKNTLVVAPFPDFGPQEAEFFSEQLGKNDVRYAAETKNYGTDWTVLASQSSHVLRFSYSESCKCVMEEKIK